MKKEHILILIVGFFLLAYLLDAVVNPLDLTLVTPYQYFYPKLLSTYPFTTVSIFLKGIALFIIPLLIFSFFGAPALIQGITLLILSALLQLYSVQDIASGSLIVPLEWSLAFTLAGVLLLLPSILYLLAGLFNSLHSKLFGIPFNPTTKQDPDSKLKRLDQHES